MSPAAADGFTQLALHVLAHVPRAGPGDLFDRRHIAWSTRTFRPVTQALLERDAAILSALWRASPALDILDVLPELHTSLPAFRRTAARALGELDAADVASPDLLRMLQRLGPAGELVHATMGLLVDEFVQVHATAIEPAFRAAIPALAGPLTQLGAHVPGLADARVELVWALGPRGRAMPGRILVGCPREDLDPLVPAIVAAHEHAVCTSGQVDHVRAEWSALVRLARCLRGAPEPLREAHARWLAGLELSTLVADAQALGLVAREDVERLRARDPRQDVFGGLAPA